MLGVYSPETLLNPAIVMIQCLPRQLACAALLRPRAVSKLGLIQ